MKSMSELKVDSIMTSNVHAIHLQNTIKDAMNLLLIKKISGAPVVDSHQTLMSVISEGTLLKLAAMSGLETPIHAILSKLPPSEKIITTTKSSTVLDVYKLFLVHHLHRIPVVDGNGKLQGIVSRSNVIKVFLQLGAAG